MIERILEQGLAGQSAWVVALCVLILALELRALLGEPVLAQEGHDECEAGNGFVAGEPPLHRLAHGVRFLVFAVLCSALMLNFRLAGLLLAALLLATGFWPALAYATSFAKGVEEESGELPAPFLTGLVAAAHLAIARGVLVSLVLVADPAL